MVAALSTSQLVVLHDGSKCIWLGPRVYKDILFHSVLRIHVQYCIIVPDACLSQADFDPMGLPTL